MSIGALTFPGPLVSTALEDMEPAALQVINRHHHQYERGIVCERILAASPPEVVRVCE